MARRTDEDGATALAVFAAAHSRRGDKGRNHRNFLETLQHFLLRSFRHRARLVLVVTQAVHTA